MKKIENIELKAIRTSPLNPRKTFDQESLQELADNIRQHGLLQPITVRKADILLNKDGSTCNYEVVCGERRFRAFKLNNEKEIPCIVREMSDGDALDAMITENLQRKDVDPIEEAFAFGQLHKNGKTIEEIALRFGKSPRFIAERIKLDNLLPELKTWVSKGWMNIGAAMHISKLTEEEQMQFKEEYDQEEIGDDTDPVNKSDALDFTRDLFMEINRAEWSKDFEGSCKTTCDKCPFNNANVGCLFYEMKPHDATCTNRTRWNNKRADWTWHLIDSNADVLVKEGEPLETGKTVISTWEGYYKERCPDYDIIIKKLKDDGYKIVNVEDLFERWSSYDEDDERLQEKLAKNEVYRVLRIETGWRGTEICIKYYEWKKKPKGEDADQATAMKLVNEYKENIRKSNDNKAYKLREVLNMMNPEDLSKDKFIGNEGLIFLAIILRKCSHKFREKCGVAGYKTDKTIFDYVLEHKDDAYLFMRDYMREILGGSEVSWSADLQQCQSMLLHEWSKDKVEEIEGEFAAKLAKKQEKIKDQLTALGYDTDGKKLEF